MKVAKTFREKIGLSQQELADYMLVTRGQLAMYETGRRSLPTKAVIKMVPIEIFLHNNPTAINPATRLHETVQAEKAKTLLDRYAKEQHYQLVSAQRKLEATQKIYTRKMRLLDVIDHLRENLQDQADPKGDDLWLDLMERYALDAIEKNGLHKQIMLQLQISGLQQQYDQAIQLLEQHL